MKRREFETTRWSLVLAAGGDHSSVARDALGALFEAYWYPLYVYARRRGCDGDAARDLIQSFMVSLIERNDLHDLRPERGRFRAFLLVALRHFQSNRDVHDRALKRGGGDPMESLEFVAGEDRYVREPIEEEDPERVFDRQWALTVLDHVFQRIRADWQATGRESLFDLLKGCLMGEVPSGGYDAVARELGATVGAAKMAVQRLRRRFHQELRAEIADTVTDDEVDDEIRYLLKALQQ